MKPTSLFHKLGLITAAVVLAGCSQMGQQKTAMATDASQTDRQLAQLTSQQEDLRQQQAQLNTLRRQLDNREATLAQQSQGMQSPQSAPMQTAMAGDSLLPPSNQPGQCFARVFVEPKYETYQERVLASEASAKIEIIPAKFAMAEERVLVSEAATRIEAIPASFKWVEQRMMVKPASSRMVEVPASYKTTTEKVLVQPAHSIWKKGSGPMQRVDEATGEIMCLVEVPAQYKTLSTRILDKPATTRLMEEPALYKTVKQQVIDQPAATRTVSIPAKYAMVKVTKLVSPAQERRIEIPASYDMVSKTKKVADGHMAWREILCDTNMTRDRIAQIQTSLKLEGFDPGRIDGAVGRNTMRAVNAFQKAKKLPVDQYLNVKTVEALGVSIP